VLLTVGGKRKPTTVCHNNLQNIKKCSIAISGLINLLNPGIFVIGGGVAQTGDLLLEPIRQVVRERSLKAASQAVRITSAVLGRRSSGIGAVVQAATLVLHHSPDPLQIPGLLKDRASLP
jgi:hypothetical protein